MAAKTFLRLVSGKLKALQAIIVSSGGANDGDLVALDSTGKLDVTVMPIGIGPDVAVVTVAEAAGLAAGDYVNIFDSTGPKVRLADNSNGREAHGFVKEAFADAAVATIFFEGPNADLSGLTAGQRVFLGVAGGILTTPLVPVTDTGKLSQLLGTATKSIEVNTDIDDCIQL